MIALWNVHHRLAIRSVTYRVICTYPFKDSLNVLICYPMVDNSYESILLEAFDKVIGKLKSLGHNAFGIIEYWEI